MAAKLVVFLALVAAAHCSVVPVVPSGAGYSSFAYNVADPIIGDYKTPAVVAARSLIPSVPSVYAPGAFVAPPGVASAPAVVAARTVVPSVPSVYAASALVAPRVVASAPAVVPSAPAVYAASAPAVVAARAYASNVYPARSYYSAPVKSGLYW